MQIGFLNVKCISRIIGIIIFLFNVQIATSQHALILDKKGKVKRLRFFTGHHLKVKLIDNEKVGGKIDAIYDSSFVIKGRKIPLENVVKVYSSRPAFKYIGGVFVVGGFFYMGVDAINNVANSRDYVFSYSTIPYAGTAVGVGLVMSYFGTRRTDVYQKGNFKIINTTPIPVKNDSLQADTAVYCENGTDAILKKINLDGCNWVIELPDGQKLEPMNIYDFLSEQQMERGAPLKIRFEYYDTKSASICMVGRTVAITCFEVLKE